LHSGKIVLQCFLTLNSAIGDFANFIAIELSPLCAIVLMKEVNNKDRVNEVYKSITHITVVLEINWKVEEIIIVSLTTING